MFTKELIIHEQTQNRSWVQSHARLNYYLLEKNQFSKTNTETHSHTHSTNICKVTALKVMQGTTGSNQNFISSGTKTFFWNPAILSFYFTSFFQLNSRNCTITVLLIKSKCTIIRKPALSICHSVCTYVQILIKVGYLWVARFLIRHLASLYSSV